MYKTIIEKDDKVVAVRTSVWMVYLHDMDVSLPCSYTIEGVLKFIKGFE